MINFPVTSNSKGQQLAIFHINDPHGKNLNMERIVTASNDFDAKYRKSPEIDTLKLSSGDVLLGEDKEINSIAVLFLQLMNIAASAVGNHEFDLQNGAAEILKNAKIPFLSCNIDVAQDNPWNGKILPSKIEVRNGHKYGLIGTSPVDLHKRSKQGAIQKQINVHNINETIKDIQKQVDKFKEQGIDKIILLSHLGYDLDKVVATSTSGIDVILGGHSHDLIFDVIENENLLYSKSGEPVVIAQEGRDGKNFGVLNIEFTQDGIIKRVQNNVGFTKDFSRNPITKYHFDKIIGAKSIYGEINSAPPPLTKDLIEPNPHAYFITDCIRKDFDADIAILHSSNIRGYFEKGSINRRVLNDILPFKNNLWEVDYSEKDLVDAIKKGAKSFVHTANKPGIFYFSGLKYSVTTTGEVLSVSFVDKNGHETPIDINNPRKDKYYRTVINDFHAMGNDGFTMLNRPNNIVEKYPFDATLCVKKVLKDSKHPIDIVDDGRIVVVKN